MPNFILSADLQTQLHLLSALIEKYVYAGGAVSSEGEQVARDIEYLLMVKNEAEEVVGLLKRSTVTKTGKGGLLDEDRARFETLARKSPALVLASCEEFLKLPRFDDYSEEALGSFVPDGDELTALYYQFSEEVAPDPSVDGAFMRIPRHPMFELMCEMYAREHPHQIPKFVAFVHACQVKFVNSQSRSGYSNLRP